MADLTANRIVLVTGPTRSGKSEWAEHLAVSSSKPVRYVATSQIDPADGEWLARIEQHRQRRPQGWQVQEVPVALPEAIAEADAEVCLLVDSLGTWLANLLEQDAAAWQQTCDRLVVSLEQTPAQVILVAEEVGWGVVPAYPIGRLFCDRMGQLTRSVGAIAQAVYLVTAGYAVDVRQLGHPIPKP
ncbi:bifunctional adenosylcobinamide kinase/adenosylcobinamide-phosphate guanylyltransferase [Pseudanabaena sp. FACHB-2040]|nr:bifunctional adenosylcobinamide kinase/adenosylcobinamide-phosphate guanylyltransferase [Pseudanabaena sp. FACHB-2040]